MNALKNKKRWYILLPLLFFLTSGSWMAGCGTETDLSECPGTSFSQTNLDTLEAQDPKFIWRVCNANEEYAMEEVETFSKKTDFRTIDSCTCSSYFSSEKALFGVDYIISEERFFPSYLDHFEATKGLSDSTEIRNTPGRYTYFFYYDFADTDTSTDQIYRVEIKREAYHE